MLSPFRSALHLGIDEHEITLVDGRQCRRNTAVLRAPWRADAQDAADALRQQLEQLAAQAELRGRRVRVVLGDALVRYFTVMPPANAADLRDCEAAAALRFEALFDEPPGRWKIGADWQAASPFLACAVPDWLQSGVVTAVRFAGLRQISLAPQFLCAWNQWRNRLTSDGWLVVAHGAQLSLGIAAGRRLQFVRRLPSAVSADDMLARLPDLLRRESLSLGRPMPAQVALLAPLAAPEGSGEGTRGLLVRLDSSSLDVPAHALCAGAVLALTGART